MAGKRKLTPPPPILGPGYSVRCPMVDVPRIESGRYREGDPLTCRWCGRGRSARVLRAYRKHWYRVHWVPFEAGTRQLVQSLGRLSARLL